MKIVRHSSAEQQKVEAMPNEDPSSYSQEHTEGDAETNSFAQQPVGDKRAKQTKDRSKNQMNPHRYLEILTVVFSGLLVLNGAIYGWFTYQQWQTSSAQLATMRYQLETARNDQRAWVTIKSVALARPLAVGERPTVILQVANSGSTPALDARIAGNVFSRSSLPPEEPSESITGAAVSRMVIGPNTEVAVELDSTEPVARPDQIDAIQRGAWKLYVTGIINYLDVFNKPHRTLFCFKLEGQGIDGWVFAAAERGNTAD